MEEQKNGNKIIKNKEDLEEAKKSGLIYVSVICPKCGDDWTSLISLFNKIGMQMRLHKISGKNEILTIAHMVKIADDFYRKKYDTQFYTKEEVEQAQEAAYNLGLKHANNP